MVLIVCYAWLIFYVQICSSSVTPSYRYKSLLHKQLLASHELCRTIDMFFDTIHTAIMAGHSNKDDVSITLMHNDDIQTILLLGDYIVTQEYRFDS